MSVLVVGSVALDTIKTPFGKEKDILGGSATFSAVSASVFSLVNLVAVVGQDFPNEYIKLLKNKGIDLTGLKKEKGKTFRWEGEYGRDFSNPKTIRTNLNVFGEFNPIIPKAYQKNKFIFLANIDPQIQEKVLNQVKKPKIVACDTMNYWINTKRSQLVKLLRRVDICLLNETEAKELVGENNLVKAGKEISKLGPSVVIIKKGEHGVLLFSQKHIFTTPAYLLESVYDPTGAGDTFAGGLMGYLAKVKKYNQKSLREAVVYGSIMATFAVEDFSLRRLQNVTVSDVQRRLSIFRKITNF
ncbi:MAG: PfkB family carbohydrate kinase [Candidatus Susulua stagnicola]|nr:PfkB family carbohydrate kinase [Candidatus Susulua stagnicola]